MFQTFAGSITEPAKADFPTITATTETVLIPTIFTPIPAMSVRSGQVFKLTVAGTCTTGTAGTLTITPRYGLVIGGTSLTASGAQNYVASITTAPFMYECYLAFQTIGASATNSTVHCNGRWIMGGAVATAASQTVVTHTSTTAVTVDSTVASGLWIGVTFSVAPSVIPRWHLWQSLN